MDQTKIYFNSFLSKKDQKRALILLIINLASDFYFISDCLVSVQRSEVMQGLEPYNRLSDKQLQLIIMQTLAG